MNLLGHSYIAVKIFPEGNKNLLIIGSLLPESFPFVRNNPFTFEEIHEGGEKFLGFLSRNFPEKQDLALGMLTHSVRFGADSFNKKIEGYAEPFREELLRQIADCSGVSLKIAKARLHNFLWMGVDFWILKEFPELVNEVSQAIKSVNIEEISALLAVAFNKEREEVEKVFDFLFKEIYQPEDLTSREGLVRIWSRQAAGLPEKDKVEVKKAIKLGETAASLLESNYRKILRKVGETVKRNLRLIIREK